MTDIAIRPLVDHANAIPSIAQWFYDEWREIYGVETPASVQQRIETWLTRNRIPTALVAVATNQVVGTVALKEHELQFSYSPWLAGLFVIPQLRHKGIGALLVDAAERKAASLGVNELYLYTPSSQAFYERLGWSVLERCQLPNGSVAVMSKKLRSNISFNPDALKRAG
jgi:N-acetylglutamate synthase-like GNAT family acetyltransferase